MNSRFYQIAFYDQYDLLHDTESRLKKAKKIISSISKFKEDPSSLTCLDLGCSSGVITSALQPYFRQMIGLDYDVAGLRAIPDESKERSTFIRGDALQLPFHEDSFDVVICAQVYEHVLNDLILFSEISRIIRTEGIIFFSGPNKLYPIEPHYKLPFLHWLPLSWADNYLRLSKKGKYFDIKSRTYHDLQGKLKEFIIYDMTRMLLKDQTQGINTLDAFIIRALLKLPMVFWRLILLPLIPNINWVIINPPSGLKKGSFHVMA